LPQFLSPPGTTSSVKILWDVLDEVKMETEILELDDLFSKMAPKKKEVGEEKKRRKTK